MLWLNQALERLERGQTVVLVTVARTRGSAPRPAGAKLLVAEDSLVGSVGGGDVERQAVVQARALLTGGARRQHVKLAPQAGSGECCGGATDLVLERLEPADREVLDACRRHLDTDGALLLTPIDDLQSPKLAFALAAAPSGLLAAIVDPATAALTQDRDGRTALLERLQDRRPRVWLFGAGHVGQALAHALAPLPFHLTWVDDRPALLPPQASDTIRPLASAAPAREVERIPAGAFVLVMTHAHALDFEIAEAALRRQDLEFVGLIGSAGKKAQFFRRSREHGLTEATLARLVCPIGLPGIRGREPAVIAASVAAQLLAAAEAGTEPAATSRPAAPLAAAVPAGQ